MTRAGRLSEAVDNGELIDDKELEEDAYIDDLNARAIKTVMRKKKKRKKKRRRDKEI